MRKATEKARKKRKEVEAKEILRPKEKEKEIKKIVKLGGS